jgi:hypothetical protein
MNWTLVFNLLSGHRCRVVERRGCSVNEMIYSMVKVALCTEYWRMFAEAFGGGGGERMTKDKRRNADPVRSGGSGLGFGVQKWRPNGRLGGNLPCRPRAASLPRPSCHVSPLAYRLSIHQLDNNKSRPNQTLGRQKP